MSDPKSNSENFVNCKYYDTNQIKKPKNISKKKKNQKKLKKKKKKSPFFFHLNWYSLPKIFDDFQCHI